jgi:hypothetical protein
LLCLAVLGHAVPCVQGCGRVRDLLLLLLHLRVLPLLRRARTIGPSRAAALLKLPCIEEGMAALPRTRSSHLAAGGAEGEGAQ